MKGIGTLILAAVLVSFSASAAPFTVPDIPDGESLHYRVYYKDFDIASLDSKSLNQQTLILEAAREFDNIYHWVGDGDKRHLVLDRVETLQNGNKAAYQFVFKPGRDLILEYWEKTVTLPGGEQVRHEKYDMINPVFRFPAGIVHPYVAELGFKAMPLQQGHKQEFYLWLSPKSVMRMSVKVAGMESIQTPAGTFECYKLQMEPNLDDFLGSFAGRVLKILVPDFTFYLETRPPHRMIRYSGPLGEVNALGAPIENHELVSINPGQDNKQDNK